MARAPFVNSLTGAPRHTAKHQGSKNSWWMHVGVAKIRTWQRIQRCWAQHTLATTNSLFLTWYTITIWSVFVGPIPTPMQGMIDLFFRQASLYAHHVTMSSTLGGQLYNIPLTEWLYGRKFCPGLHLCISNITDDMSTVKMTAFTISQLRWLYRHFGLREFVLAHHETELQIGTGNWFEGHERCYCIDPEELFLFSLTRCKTGMTTKKIMDMFFGGDYNQWSYGFCWFMLYLDLCYCIALTLRSCSSSL
jgi:hypothetical protein